MFKTMSLRRERMAERMTDYKAPHKNGAKLIALLLTLAMLLSMLPAAIAEGTSLGTVHVIVENTTFTTAVDGVEPAWTGTLVDTDVELTSDSTMMSCVVEALGDYSQTGAENNYISEINGLSEKDAGEQSGWMGTLNDWFTNEGFGGFTVAQGTLEANDEIRIMYTSNGFGEDLGSSWGNTDKTVKNVTFSAGTLDKAFSSDVHEYTLFISEDTTAVNVTPTASNKNYQVRTSVGDTEYKRTVEVPVAIGTVITVKCGDPEWPTMNDATGEAQVYTFTVAQAHTPIAVNVTVSNAGAFAKDKNGADAINLNVALDTKETYTIGDILTALHEQYSANGVADYATEAGNWGDYITKFWGVASSNCSYMLNGKVAMGLTDAVANGDTLEVSINESDYPDTEAYAAFDKTTVETDVETAFDLVLNAGSYDENGTLTMSPCAGATITVDGTATETVTDENGKATITIATTGKHIVSAVKTKTVNDKTVTAITAPVCTVNVAAASLASGTYGNVVWNVRNDGTLEFSAVAGSDGQMGGSISKWSLPTYTKNYKDQITSIVVKEGVTSISNYAFYTLTPTSVSVPSTLKTIGDDAFNGVTSITSFTCAEGCVLSVSDKFVLKNSGTEIYMYLGKPEGVITIPDGVTKVGALFSGSDITGIIFPDSVKEISGTNYTTWSAPFEDCTKLESVTIPCDITETGVFKGCTSLKEVTFKEGVTAIADYTFNNCTALTTINLPKSMVSFNAGAFSGCPAISTINVAEGGIYSMSDNTLIKNGTEIVYVLPTAEISGELVIPEGTTVIGDYAYTDNEKITSVKLPDSVTSIGKYAFQNCKNLTTINFPEKLTSIGNYAFQHSGLTEINLPAGITNMGYYVFADTQITMLTLPDGLSINNNDVFAGCTKLTEVSVGGNMGERMFQGCTALKTVTLRSGITTIGIQAFSGCTAIETISVPEGVTTIGNYAFEDCTALTSISLPASLTDLAANAFSGCAKLNNITFAEGSSYKVQDSVIYKDTQLAFTLSSVSGDITVPDGITEIGANAFKGNTAITSVKLPDSVTTIGNQAFGNCTNLKTVNLPSKLESIGNYAFSGCTSLEMVTIPSGVKKIGTEAFSNCSGMKGSIRLPGSITSFGGYMFEGCTGITSVYFEDATDAANTSYGSSLLRDCTSLTEVRIPETYSAKFNNLVYQCTALKKMTVPASVTNFSGSYLPSGFVYLDFQGVTSISSSLLSNMRNLKELVLPATLTSYKDKGNNCHPEIIYFRGTEEQWNAISFATTTLENFEKYGTVIVFNYGSETGTAPEITVQPVSATYEQGLRANVLTIEAVEIEGAEYVYQWYCDGEYVASGKECTINTGIAGEHEYYCMVRCSVDGKYSEVKSDVVTVTITAVEKPFEGSGTTDDPYQISEAKDLERLSILVNNGESYSGVTFKMTADLTLPENWAPIGATKDGTNGIKRGTNLNAFSGTFNGDNHTLTVPEGYRPLFAYVNGATIENLNIYGTKINGYGLVDCFTGVGMSGTAVTIDHVTLKSGTQTKYSGLIGARMFENGYAGCSVGYNAIIRNCVIEKGVVIGYGGDQKEIGGFAGRMQGTIENCVNHGTVKGASYVGGIIGTIDNAMGQCDVIGCTFDGTVTATGNNAGGIVGGGYSNSSAPNGKKVTVKSCKASGTISGDKNVGGILGGDMYVAQSWDNVTYSFTDNTFTGHVSGNDNVGAIIGFYDSINRISDISGNTYSKNCGADKPIGKVYVVDTNYENPTAYGDTLYVNTETSVSSCPSVAGCSWQTGYNRTDDPLGKDIDKLFSVIGGADLGDVNADGEINLSDVLLANDCYLEKAELTSDQITAADVDQNGSVGLNDVLQINDYYLEKIDAFVPAA